jgi:hypothetical protein
MLYLISTQTLASANSTISFTSIPATYDHLIIKGTLRGDNAGTGATIAFRMNNDSGSNYSYRTVLQYNISNIYSPYSATSDSFMYIGTATGGTAGTNMWGPLDAMIGDYRGGLFKSVFATSGNMLTTDGADKQTMIAGNLWKSTSAINRVDVIHASSGSWIAGSTVSLYGLAL